MPPSPPDWFAVDHVFSAADGWYVGAEDGFHVGPFRSRFQAEVQSRSLCSRLARCRTLTEQVRTVRRFVFQQTRQERRLVKNSVPRPDIPQTAGGADVRAGEKPRLHFRTNRLFAVGDVWYFATREGVDVGPYRSREDAAAGAERLLTLLRITPAGKATLDAIDRFRRNLAAD
jgi:hypothetical protein